MSTQNCVYKSGCVDCDVFYIGQSSREISTRSEEHISSSHHFQRPPNRRQKYENILVRTLSSVVVTPTQSSKAAVAHTSADIGFIYDPDMRAGIGAMAVNDPTCSGSTHIGYASGGTGSSGKEKVDSEQQIELKLEF
ncbi:unnamed protein product [Schistosoma mattheei]|uniref:Uncharacterized protein n=1 Tax=Schistosoma mattheei TaxID=31246 RepID=A0A183P5V7_9TREM|nr:unnamed protein product [Schistosoma mattheei]